ncbi:GNAT family N-acetyltransferase [Evansella cellulosilytica]|uniref:GCN5-related N-acetyltransferase n=1 Tax=Evansella cellulosilytica (strain ATCC 21833 / DSM 2522 / FERM P-1141 / JCM 9156 / N-4) TaxID=649639 RepID=E6TY82_EVAC2|nr:GNAT family protein [Evansella cellulosilytica]ADU32401.1 GCN5-related N-acetyltransferase [Evansella cellulosilytica DSM 2522]
MLTIEDIYRDLPSLETDRLRLRKITLDDTKEMFSYGSNEEVTKYVTWDTHNTMDDTKGFIEFVIKQYESNNLAPWGIEYKSTNKLIGTIDFVSWKPTHHVAEIGYVLSPDYWGKGITTEAAEKVIEFGFNKMDLVRIQAKCFVDNNASARVMEKIGMRYEGTLRKAAFIKGKHEDLKVYSILREEYSKTR